MPIRKPAQDPVARWRESVLLFAQRIENDLSPDPSPEPMTAAAATTAAAIAIGEIDRLAGLLATADDTIAAAKKESDRLRGLIAERMQIAALKSHRTAWGLMTLSDSVTYSYSHNVTTLEIQLKAERELERKCGIAEVLTSKKSLKVTYAK